MSSGASCVHARFCELLSFSGRKATPSTPPRPMRVATNADEHDEQPMPVLSAIQAQEAVEPTCNATPPTYTPVKKQLTVKRPRLSNNSQTAVSNIIDKIVKNDTVKTKPSNAADRVAHDSKDVTRARLTSQLQTVQCEASTSSEVGSSNKNDNQQQSIVCGWHACGEKFATSEICYDHMLNEHIFRFMHFNIFF